MVQPLAFAELEQVYELMARAVDSVGADNEALFLCKLSITLTLFPYTTLFRSQDCRRTHF